MTNKELKEKISRLEVELAEVKEKVEALPNEVDNGGVFKPKHGEDYWNIENDGGVYPEVWEDFNFDKNLYSIGNCFQTEQLAKDTVRLLKLIQKARESQKGFVPDWEDVTQYKHQLYLDGVHKEVYIRSCQSLNLGSIFGVWEKESECEQFLQNNHDELVWFFTEYRR